MRRAEEVSVWSEAGLVYEFLKICWLVEDVGDAEASEHKEECKDGEPSRNRRSELGRENTWFQYKCMPRVDRASTLEVSHGRLLT